MTNNDAVKPGKKSYFVALAAGKSAAMPWVSANLANFEKEFGTEAEAIAFAQTEVGEGRADVAAVYEAVCLYTFKAHVERRVEAAGVEHEPTATELGKAARTAGPEGKY